MRLFRRIGDIISANLNELIEHFEDPEKGLKLAVREMEHAVAKALDSAVKAVANEKLLAKQLAEHQAFAEQWHQRAQQSVAAGHDDLARRAIARKKQHEHLVAALDDQVAVAVETNAKLRRQIAGMQAKVAEAKRKLATFIARKRAAEARMQFRTVSALQGECATSGRFDRLFEQLNQAEAEADALDELTSDGDEQLFRNDEAAAVEKELAALKERSGI
jgi:phage shock protein A